jgi:hypothetical protein
MVKLYWTEVCEVVKKNGGILLAKSAESDSKGNKL